MFLLLVMILACGHVQKMGGKKSIQSFCFSLYLVALGGAGSVGAICQPAVQESEMRAIGAKEKEKVHVNGQVQKTGAIELTKGMTLKKAIEKAGGFSVLANRRKVRITRKGKTTTHNLQLGDGPVLQADDIITVPERIF